MFYKYLNEDNFNKFKDTFYNENQNVYFMAILLHDLFKINGEKNKSINKSTNAFKYGSFWEVNDDSMELLLSLNSVKKINRKWNVNEGNFRGIL